MSSSPFGKWGPILAAITAASVMLAALAVHVYNALIRGQVGQGDPFLDNAALLVLGVVLGVGAVGGTAVKAEVDAQAAHDRLDAAGVPPAVNGGNGGNRGQ